MIKHRAILIVLALVIAPHVYGQDFGFESAWKELSASDREDVIRFGEGFKEFIGRTRSHQQFVRNSVELAKARGFREWNGAIGRRDLTPGSKWYAVNRDRTVVFFVIGTEPVERGMRIVNTHIDSPRLEPKTRPLRAKNGVILIDTMVAGGIKNYQWVNIPLAMTGRVDKADGETVWIEVGIDPNDPVLLITDLAPHVDKDYRTRDQRDAIKTEELDPIVAASSEDGSTAMIDGFLRILESRYGISGEDLLSAEIQIVPATPARDIGLDRTLIGAYGQDDRASAWVSLEAIFGVETPRFTSVAYAVNNEEGGRSWNTGVRSDWFTTLISEVIAAQKGSFDELALRRSFARTQVLVSDCTTALNPLFPGPQNDAITSKLGYGMVVKEYGVAREANSEFFARLRRILDEAGVRWQTHSYDSGYGGSTIAAAFAELNMDVIDVGIGIVSMHSPYEVSSKVDLWELNRGFAAFYAQ